MVIRRDFALQTCDAQGAPISSLHIPTGDRRLQTGGPAASIARPTFCSGLDGRRGKHDPT
jgi:hypothetical protein